jgi:hypothetical protein
MTNSWRSLLPDPHVRPWFKTTSQYLPGQSSAVGYTGSGQKCEPIPVAFALSQINSSSDQQSLHGPVGKNIDRSL